MNKLFLWLTRLLSPVLARLGADPAAVGHILKAKLLMNDRAGFAMGMRQQKKSGMEYIIYIFLVLFGLAGIYLFTAIEHVPTAAGLFYSMMFIYLGLMLITEMSENLFDQRDLYVLLSRPINDATFSIARLLHIAVFITKFALALGTPVFIFLIFWASPWAALVYFVGAVLTVTLTMTFTLVLYLILLRSVPSYRVKKIIGYFQIVATFFFFTAYQIPSFIGDSSAILAVEWVGRWPGWLSPGFWTGAFYAALTGGGGGWQLFAQGALGAVAAVVGLIFYVRQSRDYTSNLLSMKLDGGGQEKLGAAAGAKGEVGSKGIHHPIRDFWAGLLTRTGMERVSFNFHWNIMLRDLNFKQRVYPTLVYMPVVLGFTIFKDAFQDDEAFSIGDGTLLLLLYFVLWIVVIPIGQARISDKYRAAWIFSATPWRQRGQTTYGQLMAIIAMFCIPTAILVYTLGLAYWGIEYWLDVILAAGVTVLFALLYSAIDDDIPFSRAKDDSKFQNFGPLLLVGVLAPAFGFAHYFFREYVPFFLPVACVLIWGIVIFWFYRLRRTVPTPALSAPTVAPAAAP